MSICERFLIMFLCCVVYFLLSGLCNAHIVLKLEGLDQELEKNVWKEISRVNINNVTHVDKNLKDQLDSFIRLGLRPFGYYDPVIDFFFIFQ